jgi:hypothetical protein
MRATCRCGQILEVPSEPDGRTVCPGCGARVRVRARAAPAVAPTEDDGFIRFFCPCGRRLKIRADLPARQGKCPDCGRVVPVPSPADVRSTSTNPEADTADLAPDHRAALDRWALDWKTRRENTDPSHTPITAMPAPRPASDRAEAGMRVCPNCKKPIHLGSDTCRACGTRVPRK